MICGRPIYIQIEKWYLQVLALTQRGVCGEDVDELVSDCVAPRLFLLLAEQSVSRAEVVGAYLAAQNLREPF